MSAVHMCRHGVVLGSGHAGCTFYSRLVVPKAEADDLREDRDRWVRLFNRLEAAISHHKAAECFPDDHDEALWAARDRILRAAATPDEPGKGERP